MERGSAEVVVVEAEAGAGSARTREKTTMLVARRIAVETMMQNG